MLADWQAACSGLKIRELVINHLLKLEAEAKARLPPDERRNFFISHSLAKYCIPSELVPDVLSIGVYGGPIKAVLAEMASNTNPTELERRHYVKAVAKFMFESEVFRDTLQSYWRAQLQIKSVQLEALRGLQRANDIQSTTIDYEIRELVTWIRCHEYYPRAVKEGFHDVSMESSEEEEAEDAVEENPEAMEEY